MIKQIYRFLTIALISNFLIIPAVLGKSNDNAGNLNVSKPDSTYNEKKQHENNNEEFIKKYPDLEKMPPYNKDSGIYTTLYGVMNTKDLFNSYLKQNSDN